MTTVKLSERLDLRDYHGNLLQITESEVAEVAALESERDQLRAACEAARDYAEFLMDNEKGDMRCEQLFNRLTAAIAAARPAETARGES